MQHNPRQHTAPDFATVLRAALPFGSASRGRGVRSQFLEDLARSYEAKLAEIDMEDLEVVFRGVRSPALGVATASGPDRAHLAALEAFGEAGGRAAPHCLIVLAFPGDRRFDEPKRAFIAVREHMDPDTFILLTACVDERLAGGTMRTSVLLG